MNSRDNVVLLVMTLSCSVVIFFTYCLIYFFSRQDDQFGFPVLQEIPQTSLCIGSPSLLSVPLGHSELLGIVESEGEAEALEVGEEFEAGGEEFYLSNISRRLDSMLALQTVVAAILVVRLIILKPLRYFTG